MAINTGATLLAAIQTWLARTDAEVTGSDDDWVTMAESRIHYGAGPPFESPPLRCRGNEAFAQLPLMAVQAGGTTAGTANAQTSALSGFSLAYGATASMLAGSALTNTAAMTLNIQSTGATAVKKGQFDEDVAAGDWRAGITQTVWYDGTNYIHVPVPGSVPLPADYLEMRRVWTSADPRLSLEYANHHDFFSQYAGVSPGAPRAYTILNDCIVFGPQPDQTYQAYMSYWKKLPAIGVSTNTNWLITNAPQVYLYAALIEAMLHTMYDERIMGVYALYTAAIRGLNMQDQNANTPPPVPAGAAGAR